MERYHMHFVVLVGLQIVVELAHLRLELRIERSIALKKGL